MSFFILEDNIVLKNKHELISAHVYMRLKKDNVHFSENDINVLVELYMMNGYSNKEEQDTFFQNCIDKKYKGNIQSIRNTLNQYTNAGYLEKPKNLKRFVKDSFIPSIKAKKIGAIYKLTYADNK